MNKQKFKEIIKEGRSRGKDFMIVKIKEVDSINSKIIIVQGDDILKTEEMYLRATDDNLVFKDTCNKILDILLTNNLNDLSWFGY